MRALEAGWRQMLEDELARRQAPQGAVVLNRLIKDLDQMAARLASDPDFVPPAATDSAAFLRELDRLIRASG